MSSYVLNEKLTATKLLNLAPTLKNRLDRMAAFRGEEANEIIRRGLVAELDRLESQGEIEKQRMLKLKALAAAQGGDIDALLDRMLASTTDPELPLAAQEANR